MVCPPSSSTNPHSIPNYEYRLTPPSTSRSPRNQNPPARTSPLTPKISAAASQRTSPPKRKPRAAQTAAAASTSACALSPSPPRPSPLQLQSKTLLRPTKQSRRRTTTSQTSRRSPTEGGARGRCLRLLLSRSWSWRSLVRERRAGGVAGERVSFRG